jgi:hypothetical protein
MPSVEKGFTWRPSLCTTAPRFKNLRITRGTCAGSSNARILLKACTDKTIVTKLPVTGQVNALGQTETDLEPGDLIKIRMDVPRQNTVDVYCGAVSARLQGVGEAPF